MDEIEVLKTRILVLEGDIICNRLDNEYHLKCLCVISTIMIGILYMIK